MHCKEGQKPKVRYKFGNNQERIFESPYSPIEVITRNAPIQGTDNFNSQGFGIRIYSTNNFYFFQSIVLDYKIVDRGGGNPQFRYALWTISCGENQFKSRFNVDPNTLTIDYSKKCPNPTPNKCLIEVKHNGIIIFSDQGACPINYSVQCGKCKDGEIECPTSHPPGYCCIPCKETAQKIQNLANKIVTL